MAYEIESTLVSLMDTDARFRAAGSFISDCLTAAGWTLVRTNINWTTVNSPATNTFAGYEVWHSNDAAGSLHNFYMRLDYGCTNNATKSFALGVQLGWGEDGSGGLTGNDARGATSSINVTTQVENRTANITGSTTQAFSVVGGGAGWFNVSMFNTLLTSGILLVVERLRDENGDFTDNISCGMKYNSGSGTYAFTRRNIDVAFSTMGLANVETGNLLATSAKEPYNGKVSMTPGVVSLDKGFITSTYYGCNSGKLGIAQSVVNNVSIYGENRSYYVLPSGANNPSSWASGASYNGLLRLS